MSACLLYTRGRVVLYASTRAQHYREHIFATRHTTHYARRPSVFKTRAQLIFVAVENIAMAFCHETMSARVYANATRLFFA